MVTKKYNNITQIQCKFPTYLFQNPIKSAFGYLGSAINNQQNILNVTNIIFNAYEFLDDKFDYSNYLTDFNVLFDQNDVDIVNADPDINYTLQSFSLKIFVNDICGQILHKKDVYTMNMEQFYQTLPDHFFKYTFTQLYKLKCIDFAYSDFQYQKKYNNQKVVMSSFKYLTQYLYVYYTQQDIDDGINEIDILYNGVVCFVVDFTNKTIIPKDPYKKEYMKQQVINAQYINICFVYSFYKENETIPWTVCVRIK